MQTKYNILSKEQLEFIENIGFSLEKEPYELMDKIADHLTLECIDEAGNVTPKGKLCEDILDILAEMD